MCDALYAACADYVSLLPYVLTDEQLAFINCSKLDWDGTPFYSDDSANCFVPDDVVPCSSSM